jgi:preprotein translocase subunit SecA
LLRIFGGEKVQNLMLRLGMEEDVPIESKLITKRIEAAQKAVEAQNFEARKHLLEYDDVMNKQREAVYGTRRKLLEGKDQKEYILNLVGDIAGGFVEARCPEKAHRDSFDLAGLRTDVENQYGLKIDHLELESLDRQEMADEITEYLCKRYEEKEAQIGTERLRYSERMIMLQILDSQWKDHLLSMDHLKEGIGLRGYGQKDPLVEYKKESFTLFQDMMARFEEETIKFLFYLQAGPPQARPPEAVTARRPQPPEGPQVESAPEEEPVAVAATVEAAGTIEDFTRDIRRQKERELAQVRLAGAGDGAAEVKQVVKGKKVGRNDPCPCGSGKKYKKCCGRTA